MHEGGSGAEPTGASEEGHFRELVEACPSLLFRCDASGVFTYVNPTWEERLGFAATELLGRPATAFRGSVAARPLVELDGWSEEEPLRRFETVVSSKAGDPVLLSVALRAKGISGGRATGFYGTAHECTVSKQAELAWKQKAEFYVMHVEHSVDVLFTLNNRGEFVYVSPAWERHFGLKTADAVGKSFALFVHPDDVAPCVTYLSRCLSTGLSDTSPRYRVRHRDGHWVWFIANGSPYVSADGEQLLLGIGHDISDRVASEQALLESDWKFRALFESGPMGVAYHQLCNGDGGAAVDYLCLDANENYQRLTGGDPRGKTLRELYPGQQTDPFDWGMIFGRVARTGTATRLETYVEAYAAYFDVVAYQYKPDHFVTVFVDITERKAADLALKVSEERYRALVANLNAGVVVHRVDTSIAMANPRACELLGLSEAQLLGKTASDPEWKFLREDHSTLPREEYPVNLLIASGRPLLNQTLGIRTSSSAEVVWVLVNGGLMLDGDGATRELVVSFIDITDSKKAKEEQLRLEQRLNQTQRLDALGILAGGIAHDFNNLLSGVYGYIELASLNSTEEAVKSCLAETAGSLERTRALTQQLLTFAKGGAPVRTVGALFPLVQKAAQFALSGSSVTARFDVASDLWACSFDRNQLGQVVDNLIINAQQAMPLGGTIEVRARNVCLEEKDHPSQEPGRYVQISIHDTGVGIPSEILPRIFDPFFTTKSKGHGLGLASCYSIIKRHGGWIDVESTQGRGSTFHVYLPASEEPSVAQQTPLVAKHEGRGTVLIMDDEEAIRRVLAALLRSLGYETREFSDGRAVVDHFRESKRDGERVAGMFFDLTIPGGMGGVEAAAEIRQLDRAVPIFVASGYSNDPAMARPADFGFTASLCKPFTRAEIADVLKTHVAASC